MYISLATGSHCSQQVASQMASYSLDFKEDMSYGGSPHVEACTGLALRVFLGVFWQGSR